MSEDPAITEAKKLWNQKQPKEAMQVLLKRIQELSQRHPRADRRRQVIAFLGGSVITLLIVAIVLVASGAAKMENDIETAVYGAAQPGAEIISSSTPTQDCGAWEWWSYNAGNVMDHMTAVSEAYQYLMNEDTWYEGEPYRAENQLNLMDTYQDIFLNVSYPFCVKEARDLILAGMSAYSSYLYELKWELEGEEIANPESKQYLLDMAQELMKRAADNLKNLTGEYPDFLVQFDPVSIQATLTAMPTEPPAPALLGSDWRITSTPQP